MPKKVSKRRSCFVTIEQHQQHLNEVIKFFGGDPRTIIQNVVDKYLPQYCQQQRDYHLGEEDLLTLNDSDENESVAEDLSSELSSLFN